MTQIRPINFTFSSDSAKAGTAYALLGASIVLATSSAAAQLAARERAPQITIFQPASSALNRQAVTVQNELDALQRLWQSVEEDQPRTEHAAAINEDDYSLLIVEPEELGHFKPTYGAPVKMTFLPPQEGRFSPVELDEIDLEIFDV